MITSYYDDRLRTAVISNGASAFLEKPFDVDELIVLLNEAITPPQPVIASW